MLEIKNKLYTQRFFATELPWFDFFCSVTYTQYLGDTKRIPFYYKQIHGETATIDLTKSIDDLWMAMKSDVRRKIRHAEKEGCIFESSYEYDVFVPCYNDFCQHKGLDEEINVHTLAKYNRTLITTVKHGEFSLAMHATVVNEKDGCAMLLYSCSPRWNENVDTRLIGWGNHFLHWKEFELFKTMGLKRYEWNGVCTDPNQKALYGITQFKLGFGCEAKPSLCLRTPLFVFMKGIQKILHKIR